MMRSDKILSEGCFYYFVPFWLLEFLSHEQMANVPVIFSLNKVIEIPRMTKS